MTETARPQVAQLPVPGARLYYKIRGSGPLLLLLQGGDGDADGTDALAEHLTSHYTVLSYDRRGLSRSRISDPAAAVDVATHSEDASRLLAAVTSEPALVFGSSLGAVLGLDLVSRHPEQIRLLVAHEPPVTGLLPEPERSQASQEQQAVEDLYRREGIAAAMRKFVMVAGIRFDDREPDVPIPQPGPERIANLEFFLTHDAPAIHRYRLDLPALRSAAARIVPAAGASSRAFPRHCAQALAAELGRPLAEFPGGHSGFMLRPQAFATQLRETLASHTRGSGEGYHP
jgi:pimeloyl-ACP methyl ester carboxylesterase